MNKKNRYFDKGLTENRKSIKNSGITPKKRKIWDDTDTKKIDPQGIQYRRINHLCFKCGEKYTAGHQCKFASLNFMVTEDDDRLENIGYELEEWNTNLGLPIEPNNRLLGHTNPQIPSARERQSRTLITVVFTKETESSNLEISRLSIYKAARIIKHRDNAVYNGLLSIYEDSIFVGEISQLWPELPLLANLRCGLWYSPKFLSTCYFKSTDGDTNNWSFNTSRLNLHVALIAKQRGGCMIVDSTRKGKRFPDNMSKTIPIWTCVLNRAIFNYRKRAFQGDHCSLQDGSSTICDVCSDDTKQVSSGWDCSLHLPLWVSETEKALIEDRFEGWTMDLETCGDDIASISMTQKKPLKPLWIS